MSRPPVELGASELVIPKTFISLERQGNIVASNIEDRAVGFRWKKHATTEEEEREGQVCGDWGWGEGNDTHMEIQPIHPHAHTRMHIHSRTHTRTHSHTRTYTHIHTRTHTLSHTHPH